MNVGRSLIGDRFNVVTHLLVFLLGVAATHFWLMREQQAWFQVDDPVDGGPAKPANLPRAPHEAQCATNIKQLAELQDTPTQRLVRTVHPLLKELNCVLPNMGGFPMSDRLDLVGRVIIDVGSNSGEDYSLPGVQRGMIVFAFDLLPANLERMKATFGQAGALDRLLVVEHTVPGQLPVVPWDAVETARRERRGLCVFFPLGVSDTVGKVQIVASKQTELAHIKSIDSSLAIANDIADPLLEDVGVIPLDDILTGSVLRDVWIFKSDTQGHETHVLRGARKLLASGVVHKVELEYWPKGVCAAGGDSLEILELLRTLGYSCFDWSRNQHVTDSRPSSFAPFLKSFWDRQASPKCWSESCSEFGLWDELLCFRAARSSQ